MQVPSSGGSVECAKFTASAMILLGISGFSSTQLEGQARLFAKSAQQRCEPPDSKENEHQFSARIPLNSEGPSFPSEPGYANTCNIFISSLVAYESRQEPTEVLLNTQHPITPGKQLFPGGLLCPGMQSTCAPLALQAGRSFYLPWYHFL